MKETRRKGGWYVGRVVVVNSERGQARSSRWEEEQARRLNPEVRELKGGRGGGGGTATALRRGGLRRALLGVVLVLALLREPAFAEASDELHVALA